MSLTPEHGTAEPAVQDEPAARGEGAARRRSAVVCVAPGGPRTAIRAAVEGAGFALIVEVDRGLEAVAAAGEHGATLVVMDLTLVGTLGLRLIRVLKAAAPGAAVIMVNPFDTLETAAPDAGANAVVPSDDPRELCRVLAGLAASAGP